MKPQSYPPPRSYPESPRPRSGHRQPPLQRRPPAETPPPRRRVSAAKRARMQRIRRRRRIRRLIRMGISIAVLAVILVVAIQVAEHWSSSSAQQEPVAEQVTEETEAPAPKPLSNEEKLQIIQSDPVYPEPMVNFAKKYPQAVDYVYQYPEYKDQPQTVDLSAEASSGTLPLLIQWDSRWGYAAYGEDLIGYSGCGPVSLSMAALYLTGDPQWTPVKVAELAVEKGYYTPGNGSSWALFSEGSRDIGLQVETLPLSESKMKEALDAGHPIALSVGPGDFTYTGHYMLVVGYDDTGFKVHDPNSEENSQRTWTYEVLSGQIRNLWALSKA